jgi:hypothetical protein
MTVGRSSRDAEGDARGSAHSHRQAAADDWFPSPAPVGASAKSFGSRFWVLSSEFEGSDDEIWEVDGAVEGAVGDRSAWSPPPSRILRDFLGLEQEGGGPAGRSACHRSSPRSKSPVRGRDPLFNPSDFPPLSCARVFSRDSGSPELSAFKLQVGSWSFEVPASLLGAPSSSALDLVGDVPAEERGDVDACHPHSSERVRVPLVSESIPSVVGVVTRASPTQRSCVAQSARPISGPARLGLLFSRVFKWAWRPVGTLDSTLTFFASIPDLQRAALPPFHTRVLLLPPQVPPMDRGRRDDRDSWQGRQNLKRPYEETLPLEERRVDSLSESELHLLLERQIDANHHRGRQGDRSPRLMDSGRFEGDTRHFALGPTYPRAGGGGKPQKRKMVSSKSSSDGHAGVVVAASLSWRFVAI